MGVDSAAVFFETLGFSADFDFYPCFLLILLNQDIVHKAYNGRL